MIFTTCVNLNLVQGTHDTANEYEVTDVTVTIVRHKQTNEATNDRRLIMGWDQQSQAAHSGDIRAQFLYLVT